VFDPFMAELTAQAQQVRAGDDTSATFGTNTMTSQNHINTSHLDDAVAKGETVVVGGPDTVGERFVQPTILSHVPEDSTEMTEETFGPTLAVNPVKTMDEAVERTNATAYGLAGAVFSKKNGMAIAERIRSGMTSINAVTAFAGVPSLPFGGVGESGFGRIHGPDGLKEFTYAKAITRQKYKPLLALTTFARDAKTDKRAATLINLMHGGKSTLPKR
jgi:aldehyde dehydrogenase (NAD+)